MYIYICINIVFTCIIYIYIEICMYMHSNKPLRLHIHLHLRLAPGKTEQNQSNRSLRMQVTAMFSKPSRHATRRRPTSEPLKLLRPGCQRLLERPMAIHTGAVIPGRLCLGRVGTARQISGGKTTGQIVTGKWAAPRVTSVVFPYTLATCAIPNKQLSLRWTSATMTTLLRWKGKV